jgi:hypothetical protein
LASARCRLSACILAFSSVALQSLVLRCRFSACRIEDHLFSAMRDPKSRAVAYKGKGKGDGRDTMTGNGSGKCAGKGAAKGNGKGVGEVVGKGACMQVHSLLFSIVGGHILEHPRWCPVCAATVSALTGDQEYTTRCVMCAFLHPTRYDCGWQ